LRSVWIRLRSWRTVGLVSDALTKCGSVLTSYARKELSGEALNLRAGKWHKSISLEEVKDTLSQKIRDNADVIPEVEGITQMDAFVSVGLVVQRQGRENSQFNARCITVLLHGAYYLDGTLCLSFLVKRLHDFPKGSLAQKPHDRVYHRELADEISGYYMLACLHLSVRSVSGVTM
jgi:hypothetical protein